MKAGVDYIGICTPFICHDGQGYFLLQKRSNKTRDEQGVWEGGSGKVELGLTLEQNVLKEVEEEFGVVGEIQGQLPPETLIRENNGTQTHWVMVPYFIQVDREKVRINEPDKIDEIGWFPLDQFPTPLHSGLISVLDRYPEEFGRFSKKV